MMLFSTFPRPPDGQRRCERSASTARGRKVLFDDRDYTNVAPSSKPGLAHSSMRCRVFGSERNSVTGYCSVSEPLFFIEEAIHHAVAWNG